MHAVHVGAGQVDQTFRLCALWMIVDVQVALLTLDLEHKVLRFPPENK